MGFLLQSVLREGYFKEMIQVLSDPRYGNNLTQVDATIKKHEAISADILARVCDVLKEMYFKIEICVWRSAGRWHCTHCCLKWIGPEISKEPALCVT
jgi:hypothetical protein